jgi:hypothetical protein
MTYDHWNTATVDLCSAHTYERGYNDGKAMASIIHLGESNYGATQSSIVAFEFTSFLALRDAIRDRRDRRHGDNPGHAYLWTCELIHIHHNDYSKVALLKCGTHYDV